LVSAPDLAATAPILDERLHGSIDYKGDGMGEQADGGITLRGIAERDYPALLDLMRSTWYDDMEPTVGRDRAADELLSYLERQTFSCVAVRDGSTSEKDLLGCVLAQHGSPDPKTAAAWGERRHDLEHPSSPSIYAEEMAALGSMLDEVGMSPDDTVLLLMVGPAARGLGLGRTLLEAAADYLREQGAPTLHLVTDTTCDWAFYDHLGLTRLAERAAERPLADQDMPDAYYLYGYDL
jgi:ribosomal protein S18 acetylase RimI-like enzyme